MAMPPDSTAPSGSNSSESTISVVHRSASAPGFAAVVALCGEHDLATDRELRHALEALYGNVLVDLTACEFIDSTILGALLDSARARTREGQRLELLVPAENTTITRILKIAGVNTLLPIRTTTP